MENVNLHFPLTCVCENLDAAMNVVVVDTQIQNIVIGKLLNIFQLWGWTRDSLAKLTFIIIIQRNHLLNFSMYVFVSMWANMAINCETYNQDTEMQSLFGSVAG